MLARWSICPAALAALALGACGDDGEPERRAAEAPRPQTVRCTPTNETRKVTVRPRFAAGDVRMLTIEKSREDSAVPAPARSASGARVEVREAGGGSASLRWTTQNVALSFGADRLPADLRERLATAAEDVTIDYLTDADGAFGQVENLEDLRSQVSRAVDTFEEVVEDDAESLAAVRRSRALVESDAFIQSTLIEDQGLMHASYGIELEPDAAFEGETELPNPFGGAPVPATARYRLTSFRDGAGCIAYTVTIDPDPDALARLVEDAAGSLAPGAADPAELEDLRLRQELRYAYDAGSGWIARVELTKRISIGARRRTDRTVITSAKP